MSENTTEAINPSAVTPTGAEQASPFEEHKPPTIEQPPVSTTATTVGDLSQTPPAAPQVTVDPRFSYTYRGKTYTFEKPISAISSPGWMRKNRRREGVVPGLEEPDFMFAALEEIAGDEFLTEVIDVMTRDEWEDLQTKLNKALGSAFQ